MQRHLAFRFADLRREFLLDPNHFARVSVRELERLHEFGFRQFIGRAFDHDDVVFRADVNEIEIALRRARSWVGFATNWPFDATDAHRADRAGERNVGNSKARRRRR